MLPVAALLGLSADDLVPYGNDEAKVRIQAIARQSRGQLVRVTGMFPSPAGEGKTTVSIGLADALRRLGHSSVACLREPSMGPVFGLKGGGTGAGLAELTPADSINLHFTGDLHAITSAHNRFADIREQNGSNRTKFANTVARARRHG